MIQFNFEAIRPLRTKWFILNRSKINIFYVRQKEPKGLGHAILCAKRFVGNEPFAVLLGDDVVYNDEYPCLKQLMDVYDKTEASVLGCQLVPQEKVSSYGIVDGKPTENPAIYTVNDMVEKPAVDAAPSRMAVLGRYVISPEIFEILEQTKPGKGGEIQLTDALKVLAKQENMTALSFEGRRYDVGDKEGFLEMGVSPVMAPDKPTYVTIHFEKGIPTAIDGKEMGAVELVKTLNKLGGENGIGLATGSVMIGFAGQKARRREFLLMGPILKEAEALETKTKSAVSSKIFIDKNTYASVADKLKVCEAADNQEVFYRELSIE